MKVLQLLDETQEIIPGVAMSSPLKDIITFLSEWFDESCEKNGENGSLTGEISGVPFA
jgi:hypothetical protein